MSTLLWNKSKQSNMLKMKEQIMDLSSKEAILHLDWYLRSLERNIA